MGKQGPCFHCGVTSTPLWRNGPPDKPVLCNACGSRWRIKGTLVNYTPLHARPESDEYEDQRVSKVKTIFPKIRDAKLKKRKLNYENFVGKTFASNYNPGFLKSTDEATSNKSSSGSALSHSESFGQFSGADASDFTGADQSAAWDTQVPSKKRTCVMRSKSSPVDKLIKDLHAILHEQQSSYQSGSSEEDLLFESDTPMVSVEIGHGSVLIKHPSSFVQEDESEANSLSFGNKLCTINEAAYCGSASLSGSNCFKRSYDQTQEVESRTKFSLSKDLQNAKKPLQEQNLNIPEKEITEGLKRGLNKSGIGSLFNLPNIKLDSCNDEDLLLDVPSNGSFPEAELLLPSSSITSSSSCIYQDMVLR